MVFGMDKYPHLLVAAILSLTGCSMAGNQYSCPMPDGVRCLSTRDVYAQSHNGQTPKTMSAKKGQKEAQGVEVEMMQQLAGGTSQTIVGNDASRPVRTAAQVMRIWIAPWQDKQDDLVMPGYLYTEIEPRKWLYGLPESKQEAFFTPLEKTLRKQTDKE